VRKSKFSSEETADGAAPLELDDPDFWRKVLPDLVTPQTVLDRLEVRSLLVLLMLPLLLLLLQ
jgi:hypothetical protein